MNRSKKNHNIDEIFKRPPLRIVGGRLKKDTASKSEDSLFL